MAVPGESKQKCCYYSSERDTQVLSLHKGRKTAAGRDGGRCPPGGVRASRSIDTSSSSELNLNRSESLVLSTTCRLHDAKAHMFFQNGRHNVHQCPHLLQHASLSEPREHAIPKQPHGPSLGVLQQAARARPSTASASDHFSISSHNYMKPKLPLPSQADRLLGLRLRLWLRADEPRSVREVQVAGSTP